MTVLTQDLGEGLGVVKDDSFLLRPGTLLIGSGHGVISLQTCHIHTLCAKAECSACAVDGYIPAAEDDYLFANAGCTLFKSTEEIGVDLNSFQVVPRKRKPGSLMGSHCHIDSVKAFLQKSGHVLDLHSGLHGDISGLQDILDLLVQSLSGQTVGGDSITQLSAKLLAALKNSHRMSELRSKIGCCKSGGTSADNSDLLSGGRFMEGFLLPFTVVVLCGKPLQVPDGNRLVQVLVLALQFAAVYTDITQAVGEGYLFPYCGIGCRVVSLADKTDIAGNIDMCRTSGTAGYHIVLFALLGVCQFVADGSGRTYLCAGFAETAVGIRKEPLVQRSGIDLQVLSLLVLKNLHSSQVVAGTYTAAAKHAAVHVMQKKRISFLHLKAFGAVFHTPCLRSDVLHQDLQLTVSVFRTCRAVLRMSCQKKLQSQHAAALYFLCLGMDHHPVLCLQHTGSFDLVMPFYFHNTHSAGPKRRQIFVMAQVRNIDPGLQCALQDIFSLLDFQLFSIYRNDSHYLSSKSQGLSGMLLSREDPEYPFMGRTAKAQALPGLPVLSALINRLLFFYSFYSSSLSTYSAASIPAIRPVFTANPMEFPGSRNM